MACALKPWRDDQTIQDLIIAATAGTQRDLKREIADAIRNARCDWQPGASPRPPRPLSAWPKRNDEMVEAILADGFGNADLWEASPRRFECDSESNISKMLALLFPGDPLLCLGWKKHAFATRPRREWCDFRRPLQFIVPSPMSAPEGLTREGNPSAKTNANTGPRRYLVVEFDFKPAASAADAHLARIGAQHGLQNTCDLCASLLHYLARFAPLALVVWSGGKSLQGWFPAARTPPETLTSFFRLACLIGADRATWTPSQFVRIPYGLRDNGNRQSPIYFNPSVLPL